MLIRHIIDAIECESCIFQGGQRILLAQRTQLRHQRHAILTCGSRGACDDEHRRTAGIRLVRADDITQRNRLGECILDFIVDFSFFQRLDQGVALHGMQRVQLLRRRRIIEADGLRPLRHAHVEGAAALDLLLLVGDDRALRRILIREVFLCSPKMDIVGAEIVLRLRHGLSEDVRKQTIERGDRDIDRRRLRRFGGGLDRLTRFQRRPAVPEEGEHIAADDQHQHDDQQDADTRDHTVHLRHVKAGFIFFRIIDRKCIRIIEMCELLPKLLPMLQLIELPRGQHPGLTEILRHLTGHEGTTRILQCLPKVLHQLTDVLVAELPLLLHAFVHRHIEGRVHIRYQRLHMRDRIFEMCEDDGHRGVAIIWHLTGQHLVHRTAEAVDIRTLIRLPRAGLFRRNIVDGAHDGSIDRLLRRGTRDAEVRHLHISLTVDDDVLRLDIPVHDAHLMRELDAGRRLQRDGDGLLRVHASRTLDIVFQCDALDELHHDIVQLRLRIIDDIVDRDDVRMIQLRRRLGLILKLPDEILILAVLLLQHLDRDHTAHLPIVRTIDIAHAALSDQRIDLITFVEHLSLLQHHIVASSR